MVWPRFDTFTLWGFLGLRTGAFASTAGDKVSRLRLLEG